MLYLTADQHFGHTNIIRLCNRPFKNADEMDDILINNWNSVVKPDDTIYVLGDFMYKSKYSIDHYVTKLQGHKHLILGNHDRLIKDVYEKSFESVQYYLELEYAFRQFLILFHYPMLSWNKKAKGSIHCYGHVHTAGQMRQISDMKTWNVGVDVNSFCPISLDDIIAITKDKAIYVSDASNVV